MTSTTESYSISLADLCHKYYKAKPDFMSLDLEGIGDLVMRSNDWNTDKCIPDLIYAENWQHTDKHLDYTSSN